MWQGWGCLCSQQIDQSDKKTHWILHQLCLCIPIFISAPRINPTHTLPLLRFYHILCDIKIYHTHTHTHALVFYTFFYKRNLQATSGLTVQPEILFFSRGFLHVRCCWCIFKSFRKLAAGVWARQVQLPAAAFRLMRRDKKEGFTLAKSLKLWVVHRSAGCAPTCVSTVHKQRFRFQAICMITVCWVPAAFENMQWDTAQLMRLTVWPEIVTSAEVIWSVCGVWPNTTVHGSQGAERVFGLGRIIHSPLKRIGESRRLWWVVSWCLFHITRTRLFVSQPGPPRHNHRVTESIMGKCYCAGDGRGTKEGEEGEYWGCFGVYAPYLATDPRL